MMKTSNSLTKRAISLLLTIVMVIGLLPAVTFDAQAAVSFNGISNPQEYTGNGPKYGFSYSPDTYGMFTRFSIVRINTPDNDSVLKEQVDQTANAEGDPSSGSNQLFSSWEQLRDFSNYEVIGSVDIGSSTKPVAQAALNAYWYDTTAMGYTKEAVEHTSDRQAAIVHYIESKEQLNFSAESTGTTRKGFFSWDEWCDDYPGCKGLELPSWIADGSSSSIEQLFSVWGETGTSEDVKQFASSNDFVNSLLAYLGGDELAKDKGFWVEDWQQNISNFFSVKDQVTYRIVVEPGLIVKNINTNPSSYYAMTARDIAAVSLMLDVYGDDYYGFTYDMGNSALQDMCNCLRGITNEFHGYYWDDVLNTYVVTNKDDRAGLFKGASSETTAKGKELRNLLFGMNTSGTATESERNGFPQYALLFITPYFNGKQSQSFKIQKILNGGTEEDKNYEWEFEVVLDRDAEGEIIYVSADGTRSEPQTISFMANVPQTIMLKGGESCEITGLPAGTKFTVTEVNGGADGEQSPPTPSGTEFMTVVSNSGAAEGSEFEGMVTDNYTEGTLSETGTATVVFTNTAGGEPAHLILDYNLNEMSASSTVGDDTVTGEITADTQVSCGIHKTGLPVTVDASISGKVLNKGEKLTIGYTESGEEIVATFKGVYTAAKGGDLISESTNFEYVLVHPDLTILYCQWDIGSGKHTIEPNEGSLYTVYWDYNYDGGGVTSCTAGTWKYQGQINFSCNCGHSGTGTFNPELSLTIEFGQPEDPIRNGYSFKGWAEKPNAGLADAMVEVPDPGKGDTFFGVWLAEEIKWDANGGTWEGIPSNCDMMEADKVAIMNEKVWDKEIPVPDSVPTRTGYTFDGWYIDPECTQPIETYEEGILPGRVYYAGWTAERVIVTYYDTREGTSVVHTQEYLYGDILDAFEPMESTVGWTFENWATNDGLVAKDGLILKEDLPLVYHPGDDVEDGSIESDKGYWTLDFFAQWEEKKTTYHVAIKWNDFNNNDDARPQSIRVGLVDSRYNNSVIEGGIKNITGGMTDDVWEDTFTNLPISDNDSSLQKRTYGIVFLGYTDRNGTYREIKAPALDGQEGEITLAAPSTADSQEGTWTTYQYGVNNYGISSVTPSQGEYDTTITFDHALITTGDDIQFTIDWDDDNDNDGVRPKSVMLVLYANGVPVSEFPMHNAYTGEVQVSAALCDVANDGDTWTYTFKDYQRYNDGKAIDYTVAIKNPDKTTTFNLNGYTTTYIDTNGDSAIGDHNGCTVSRPIELHEVPFSIVWDDENNRDGQRPEFVSVSLMSYQWNDHTYQWEYVEMATQTVHSDDVNTMTAGEWTGVFELDADSLKYPVYHDGLEAIYHLVVTSDLNAFIPEGSFEYGWVESAYGNQKKVTPQVIISQNTNTVSVTANVYWNDSQNNDDIRPENIILQLYSHAPGEEPVAVPGAAYRVTISGDEKADNWYYTFSGMPKYADGHSGVELIYTIQVFEVDGEPLYGYYIVDSNGEEEEVLRYEASYLTESTENDDNVVGDGSGTAGDEGTVETKDFTESDRAYVKLTHIAETQTMNFSVNWHDEDNRDNVRPEHVMVDLYKTVGDNTPVFVQTLDITENKGTWTYRVTGLAGYENGLPVRYSIEVPDDVQQQLASLGYTVTTQDNIVHLYYTPGTGSITTQIYWSDDDNNDGYRPDSVIAELYANGVATGKTVDLNATNDWTWTWTDLDVHYVEGTQAGTDIIYSVQVQTPEHYTVTYNPTSTTVELNQTLYVQLYHGGDVQPVPVTVYWNDFRLSRRV